MKRLNALLSLIFITQILFGQLSGSRTIPSTDYPSIKVAADSLNAYGVGTGGITFNVTARFTEPAITEPISLTATVTSTDPILFQKSGSGANPLITAYMGTKDPDNAVTDGIWNLIGSDYVTIKCRFYPVIRQRHQLQ